MIVCPTIEVRFWQIKKKPVRLQISRSKSIMSHLSNLSWVMSDTEDWWKKGEREQTSQREKGWTRTNKSKREQLTVKKKSRKMHIIWMHAKCGDFMGFWNGLFFTNLMNKITFKRRTLVFLDNCITHKFVTFRQLRKQDRKYMSS